MRNNGKRRIVLAGNNTSTKREIYNRRRKEDLEDKKLQIIDIAQKIILEDGLHNVTMSRIMEESDTSRATMYRYFKSLDPIALEIQKRMIDRILSDFSGYDFGGRDAAETMSLGLGIMIDNFVNNVDAYNYLSIFDHFYASDYPDEKFARDYLEFLVKKFSTGDVSDEGRKVWERMLIYGDVVFTFLQKLAHRVKKSGDRVNINMELAIARDIVGMIFKK